MGIKETARIVEELDRFIAEAVAAQGGDTRAVDPGHRVPFHWPPHPVSADYHLHASDWAGQTALESHGETFVVQVAQTVYGVFGRCERFWNEARGDTEEEMLQELENGLRPLFLRQHAIARTIGRPGRYDGAVRDLPPEELIKLLYCLDRDVAREAMVEIETGGRNGLFTPALVRVMRDDEHPQRRTAQWCVLDIFEDLPSFCRTSAEQDEAVDAIRGLIWNATDDFARTVYKAGVVLGGHVCTDGAADALIACVEAPSRIGRRSAVHGVFHLAEWMPERSGQVIAALQRAAETDPEPALRVFAASMARDVAAGETDHMAEPRFPGE